MGGDGAVAPATAAPLTVVVDGKTFTYRHVTAEPQIYRPFGPGEAVEASPGLRIGGAADATEANRAMGVVCGMDPALAESYGAYGDPVVFDDSTGDYIYWIDCR